MALVVDCLVSAREGMSALDMAIEATVDKIGRLSGKDAMSYLEAYKSEMQMRNIPEDRRPTRANRATSNSRPIRGAYGATPPDMPGEIALTSVKRSEAM